jgi:hypothetical protein
MTTSILTAVSAAAWEARLVAGVEGTAVGLHVARRCVDLADLLAAALAGHGQAALISADLRDLDRDALGQLLTASVAPVGVIAPSSASACSSAGRAPQCGSFWTLMRSTT